MFGTKDIPYKRVKMFYTMEETKEALSLTEDQVRALSKEGRLREFRDGPRLMYKGDQVEALLTSGSYTPQPPLVLPETKKAELSEQKDSQETVPTGIDSEFLSIFQTYRKNRNCVGCLQLVKHEISKTLKDCTDGLFIRSNYVERLQYLNKCLEVVEDMFMNNNDYIRKALNDITVNQNTNQRAIDTLLGR